LLSVGFSSVFNISAGIKVLEFDFENERLSLSIKELLEKPVKEEVKEEAEYDTSYLKDEDTSFNLGDKFKDIEL